MASGHHETVGKLIRSAAKPAPGRVGIRIALQQLGAMLRARMARPRQARALTELDVRLLRDIGVTPETAERELARSLQRAREVAKTQIWRRLRRAVAALLCLE